MHERCHRLLKIPHSAALDSASAAASIVGQHRTRQNPQTLGNIRLETYACLIAADIANQKVLTCILMQDMAGGNLTVWKEQGQNGQLGTPEGSIRPAENLLVSFRGNAPHRCAISQALAVVCFIHPPYTYSMGHLI